MVKRKNYTTIKGIPKEIIVARAKPVGWFTRLLWSFLKIHVYTETIPNPIIESVNKVTLLSKPYRSVQFTDRPDKYEWKIFE